jgi:hypothetical protein
VEAEHYDNKTTGQNGTGWEVVGPKDGFSGVLGMEVFDEDSNPTTYVEESARLDYEINFVKTGTYYVWILAYAPDSNSDSCHAGLDGEAIPTLVGLSGWDGDYEWNNDRMGTNDRPLFEVTTTGVHTFNIWMREDGLIIDKIVLSTNPDFTLTGSESGPPESERLLPGQASGPDPANEATDVPRYFVLMWKPGEFAAPVNGHKVYFGESFNDVNDATGAVAQTAASYTPAQRLDFSKIYYWRVDEVNAPVPRAGHIEFKGKVWQFTTEPIAYVSENITATASSSGIAQGPENTVNGSGLDVNDLHSMEPTDMWLSGSGEPESVWIQYEFDKVCKLHQMWVWNYNQMMESIDGLGFKDVTIEYSTNGIDYMTLGTTREFVQAPGMPDYAHNTIINFGGAAAKYVMLTANSNWGDIQDQYGLSEVRCLYIPVLAREPNPADGATDVDVDVTFSWRAGREADKHDVYLSKDEQAVIDGTAFLTTVTENSYSTSLDSDSTYYWRVDEVNDVEIPTMLEGDIWSFTTKEYLVVDDPFSAWLDGDGDPTNGSLVGYENPPFAEENIVHSGEHSMPFFYDNSTASYSEATINVADLPGGASGMWLTMWLRGNPDNSGQFYVKINDTKVYFAGGGPSMPFWTQWMVPIAAFGIDLSDITTLSIGVDGGGSGLLYIDDISINSAGPPEF